MILIRALIKFLKDKFDIDILWVLSIIGLIAYGIASTQAEYEKSIQKIINKNLEIEGYRFSNISDIIINKSNRTEEISFLSEKNVTITVKTINRKKKLVVTCKELKRKEVQHGAD